MRLLAVAALSLLGCVSTARAQPAWYQPAAAPPGAVSPPVPALAAAPVPLPAQPSEDSATDQQAALLSRLEALEQEVQHLRSANDKLAEQTESDREQAQQDKDLAKKLSQAQPSLRFTMQLQADAYAFGQDQANVDSVGPIDNGTAFRRARVGWLGDWKQTEYRIEFDFALPGRPSFLDVWAGLKEVPVVNYIRVGHFFEPFSLERLTPNRYVTFMERSLPDAPFAPARNLGIAAFDNSADERMTWAMGLFGDGSDNFGDDVGQRRGVAATGRLTWLPYWNDSTDGRQYVHLGLAGSIRKPDADRVRFASQPEARLGSAVPNVPLFVNTGFFDADQTRLVGTEFAWISGAFSLQSEFMLDSVHRTQGDEATFSGWYVTGSWFLTGEHRPYRRKMPQGGVFDRVRPYQNFFLADHCGDGPGAWELACRLSHLDFNSGGIQGGTLTDFTVGLNWYLTPYLRLTSNYIRANLNDPTVGSSAADIFGIRVGYEF